MAKTPKYFYFRVNVKNKGTTIELEDASDVDVEEVVRSMDCIHFDGSTGYCGRWDNGPGRPWVYGNDYCSKGERKEDEA